MGGSRCKVFCGKGFDDAQESRKSQFYGHKKYRTLANPVPERSFYRPGLDKKRVEKEKIHLTGKSTGKGKILRCNPSPKYGDQEIRTVSLSPDRQERKARPKPKTQNWGVGQGEYQAYDSEKVAWKR